MESLYADVWRFENYKMAELKAFVLNRQYDYFLSNIPKYFRIV